MTTPKKRGRPATGRGVHEQVRLTQSVSERIERVANELGESRPEALRTIIRLGLTYVDAIRNMTSEHRSSLKTAAEIMADLTKADVRRMAWDKTQPGHKDF